VSAGEPEDTLTTLKYRTYPARFFRRGAFGCHDDDVNGLDALGIRFFVVLQALAEAEDLILRKSDRRIEL
jgi:hypothetical protein